MQKYFLLYCLSFFLSSSVYNTLCSSGQVFIAADALLGGVTHEGKIYSVLISFFLLDKVWKQRVRLVTRWHH